MGRIGISCDHVDIEVAYEHDCGWTRSRPGQGCGVVKGLRQHLSMAAVQAYYCERILCMPLRELVSRASAPYGEPSRSASPKHTTDVLPQRRLHDKAHGD